MKKFDKNLSAKRRLDFSTGNKDSFEKQSHSALDSQSIREDQRGEDLISSENQLRLGVNSQEPPMNPSPMKVSIQNVTPLHRFGHQSEVSKQDPLNSKGQIRVKSRDNTIQSRHVIEQCLTLLSKSEEIAKEMSGTKCETNKTRMYKKDPSLHLVERDTDKINETPDCVLHSNRMDEKPLSPATRALMCDEEHEIMSEKETTDLVTTSQEKEDEDSSSDIYLEQERQIMSNFRDHLIQISNSLSTDGTNVKQHKPEWLEQGKEEQGHRD